LKIVDEKNTKQEPLEDKEGGLDWGEVNVLKNRTKKRASLSNIVGKLPSVSEKKNEYEEKQEEPISQTVVVQKKPKGKRVREKGVWIDEELKKFEKNNIKENHETANESRPIMNDKAKKNGNLLKIRTHNPKQTALNHCPALSLIGHQKGNSLITMQVKRGHTEKTKKRNFLFPRK